MKECTKCFKMKGYVYYYAKADSVDGLQPECKACNKLRTDAYGRTFIGFMSKSYSSQKLRSKKRNHAPPLYTKDQLLNWVIEQPMFDGLWNNWVNSKYSKNLKPSIDRIDDTKGYSFDNIQMMTWDENNKKGHLDSFNGTNTSNCKAVDKLTLEGEFIAKYHSSSAAARGIGKLVADICLCCKGGRKTAYGFKWRYAE